MGCSAPVCKIMSLFTSNANAPPDSTQSRVYLALQFGLLFYYYCDFLTELNNTSSPYLLSFLSLVQHNSRVQLYYLNMVSCHDERDWPLGPVPSLPPAA